MEIIAITVAVTVGLILGAGLLGIGLYILRRINTHLTWRIEQAAKSESDAARQHTDREIEMLRARLAADIPHTVENLLAKHDNSGDNTAAGLKDTGATSPNDFWNNSTSLREAKEQLERGETNPVDVAPDLMGLTHMEAWRRLDERILDLEQRHETPNT